MFSTETLEYKEILLTPEVIDKTDISDVVDCEPDPDYDQGNRDMLYEMGRLALPGILAMMSQPPNSFTNLKREPKVA